MNRKALIQKLGEDLDHHVFPSVRIGGVLVPATPTGPFTRAGSEKSDAKSKSRGSAAGSRKRAARRQGSSGRSSNSTSPSVSERLRGRYEAQLDALERAYPGTQVWPRDDGVWLLVPSTIVDGLEKAVTFLVCIPYIGGAAPRGWGYWKSGGKLDWIGPRHTNFPDGSICSYTIEDGTWQAGGDLVTLTDFYTLWAFRHLHLEACGRWPGYHTAPHPYERMLEFQDDEYCGCGSVGLLYGDCCKPKDFRHSIADLAEDFRRRYSCELNERTPPPSAKAFVEDGDELPTATSLFLEIADMARLRV